MFTLRKIEGGRINVFEPAVYPVGSKAVTEGEALVLSGGKLTACGQEVTPTFIALESGAENTEIHVGRVESNQVYETAAVSGVTLGAKYKLTLDATGILATAASTGGAEVVAINEDSIYVRF
jgi:hypothetical protein